MITGKSQNTDNSKIWTYRKFIKMKLRQLS